jgi:hypothetical protein
LTAIPRERGASEPFEDLTPDCPAACAAYRRFLPLPAAAGPLGGDARERLAGGGLPPAANVVAAAVATPHLGGSVWRQQAPTEDATLQAANRLKEDRHHSTGMVPIAKLGRPPGRRSEPAAGRAVRT